MDVYYCQDCGFEWDGNKCEQNCPECGTENIAIDENLRPKESAGLL